MLETHQRRVGYLDWICDALKKLARIDILIELDKSETESAVRNQNKGKQKEVIELEDNKEKMEKAENTMEGVKEGSVKRMSSSLTPSWYSTGSSVI